MALAPIFKKAYWTLWLGVTFYGCALVALTNPFLQRHVLYAPLVQKWWLDSNKPEQFGFAKNQVTPFNFTTPDNETIYAWHVMPLGLYAKHEAEIIQQSPGCADNITKTKAFQLLRDGQNSKLIINCGYFISTLQSPVDDTQFTEYDQTLEVSPAMLISLKNAGNVAQGWRAESYRSITDGSTTNIHILAIDYRGYGLSTGFPTEEGMITDGIAAVDWAMNVAKVPSNRIVVLGQSLGTAVTSAVVEHYAVKGVEFAGAVIIAAFTDLPNLLTSYSIAGYVPILSPLRLYPPVQKLFTSRVVDKWASAARLANFVRVSKRVRLTIIHARDDYEIPCRHSDALFVAAANATTEEGMSVDLIEKMKARNTVDMGDGAFISTWKAGGNKIIRQEMVSFGGHNSIMVSAQVGLAVLRAFDLNERGSLPL